MTAPDFRRALCRGLDPEIFETTNPLYVEQAKAICFECPIWAECMEYGKALDHSARAGVIYGAIPYDGDGNMIGREQRNPRLMQRADRMRDDGATYVAIAVDLGVHPDTVRRWLADRPRTTPAVDTCKNGHVRTEANTLLNTQGKRVCRPCRADRSREVRARQRERVAA